MSADQVTSLAAERERRAAQERDVADDLSPGDDEFNWTRFWADADRRMFEAIAVAPGFSEAQRRILGEVFKDINTDLADLRARIAMLEAAAPRQAGMESP
jgi:hypothetical protein